MSTYSLIIKKIVNTENNFFSSKYENDNIDNIIRILFINLENLQINHYNKFKFFYETLDNFYIKGKNKEEEFIYYFYKIQKTYHILTRFANRYRYNKAKIVVNTDICLNEIKNGSKNVMCILHKNSKYLFHVNDLIKIFNTSLTNSHMFFSEPLPIKNPYNNLPFEKSILYNIYYFIKYNTNYNSELIIKFYECDFSLTLFKCKNEYLLREYSINNFVYKSTSESLKNEIENMIEIFNLRYCKKNQEITIDKDFPKDKLIKIFQPYLLLFVLSEYAYLSFKKREALYFFKIGLQKFQSFNSQFGRKKFKIIMGHKKNFKKYIKGKFDEFDDRHIKFNDIQKQNREFLTDHLKYEETNYLEIQTIVLLNQVLNNTEDNETIENETIENETIDEEEGNNEVLWEDDEDELEEEEEEEDDSIS
jgi:hypothetical protein